MKVVTNDVGHQRFHLGDILSITTGRLVSPDHMDGVYKILNFMTGDDLYTHALGRAADVCKPHLLRQFPQLAFVNVGEIANGTMTVERWLEHQVFRYGAYFDVENIASFDAKHPIEELIDLGVSEDKIVTIVNGDES